MPTYRLAFRDQPANLLERLKPALVSQGDPAIYVVQVDDVVVFTGGGASAFLLQARAAEALTDVWPEWRHRLAQ
jgi:hypothetical protein